MVWREGAVCVIVRRDAESARVRVPGMLHCDYYTASASVHASSGNDTHDMTFAVPPLRVDNRRRAPGTIRRMAMRRLWRRSETALTRQPTTEARLRLCFLSCARRQLAVAVHPRHRRPDAPSSAPTVRFPAEVASSSVIMADVTIFWHFENR